MADKKNEVKAYFPTTRAWKAKLDLVVGSLSAQEPFASSGNLPQQAVANASWAWMLTIDAGELARSLAPYVERFTVDLKAAQEADAKLASAAREVDVKAARPLHPPGSKASAKPPKKQRGAR